MDICCVLSLLLLFFSYSGATCPALEQKKPMVVECTYENKPVSCKNGNHSVGTAAEYKCNDFYQLTGTDTDKRRTCLQSGNWSQWKEIHCELDCGLKEVPFKPQIISGQETKRAEWPWHAAIYVNNRGKYDYICGGTLIQDRFVVTASHCITEKDSTELFSSSSLKIILGKYSISYYQKDENQQEFNVNETISHEAYQALPIKNDIAVLLLDRQVNITVDVRPACMPGYPEAEDHLTPLTIGTIPGWGVTENGTTSETLRVANFPFVKKQLCIDRLPTDLQPNAGQDVFCASHFNDTTTCSGDSGGGFVFPFGPKGFQKWYLEGIVSWGVTVQTGTEKKCDPRVTFFTKFMEFKPWVIDTINKFLGPSGTLLEKEVWSGKECRNHQCCKDRADPNKVTGSGFVEYSKRCLKKDGRHCIGTSGCARCWCPRSFPQGFNDGPRPHCFLEC